MALFSHSGGSRILIELGRGRGQTLQKMTLSSITKTKTVERFVVVEEVIQREIFATIDGEETVGGVTTPPKEWTEKLASSSEACVKADQAPDMTISELTEKTLKELYGNSNKY